MEDVYVLTIDWLDDHSTVRQSVDAFKHEEKANEALQMFDIEVADWLKKKDYHSWVREGDGNTFIEYGKPGNYYDSHAVAKITKCTVK